MDKTAKRELAALARAKATVRLPNTQQTTSEGAVHVAFEFAKSVIKEGGGDLGEFTEELNEIETHLKQVAPR
jgi:hypothetical protein